MAPLYDYLCTKGHEFEQQQSIKEKPLEKCPKCKSSCKRLISNTNFVLKGSGWYKDGYSSAGPKKR